MPKRCIICGDPVIPELDDRYCPVCDKLRWDASVDSREFEND